MSKLITSGPLGFLFENHLLSSLIALALLIAGVVAVSAPLLIAAGVVAYGWPLLYVYALDAESKAAKSTPARLGKSTPSAVGAH